MGVSGLLRLAGVIESVGLCGGLACDESSGEAIVDGRGEAQEEVGVDTDGETDGDCDDGEEPEHG